MICNSLVGALDVLLLFFLQAKLPEKGMHGWGLGLALLAMQMGGIAGAKLSAKVQNLSYRSVFAGSVLLVLTGFLLEHTPLYYLAAFGGFLSAIGDDALQVRTNVMMQKSFPSEQRATLTSVDSFLFSVLMIVLSPLAGILFSNW